MTLDGKTYYSNTTAQSEWSVQIGSGDHTGHTLSPGSYSLSVQVIDVAGNVTSFNGVSFTVQGASGDPIPSLATDSGNGTTGANSDRG